MELKKILIFPLIAVFCFSASGVFAQKKSNNKSSAKSLKTKQKKQSKTISGGIMNGKAVDLVVPVYPPAATIIGLYGTIKVKILIDIDGKGLIAEVISGNPILRSASINAALQSKFVPLKIGGEFVRVSGQIHYNFLPTTLNWLEIGYILNKPRDGFYSLLKIEHYFPIGFEQEIQLLNQNEENRDEISQSIIASIQSKLSNNPKSSWLFSAGLVLGKLKENCCRVEEKTRISAQEIRVLLQTKPDNISSGLISNLEKLVFYIENPLENTYHPAEGDKLSKTLRNIEQIFPMFGK